MVWLQMVNIKDRMKRLKGVTDVYWNPNNLSLAIYYECDQNVDNLKIKVVDQIDKASLHRAIETVNFIRVCDE